MVKEAEMEGSTVYNSLNYSLWQGLANLNPRPSQSEDIPSSLYN